MNANRHADVWAAARPYMRARTNDVHIPLSMSGRTGSARSSGTDRWFFTEAARCLARKELERWRAAVASQAA